MNNKEILQFCLEKGILVDRDILGLFDEVNDSEIAKLVIEKIGEYTNKKIITKNVFYDNQKEFRRIFSALSKEKQKKIEKLKIKLGFNIEISKEIEYKKDREKIMRLPDFQDGDYHYRHGECRRSRFFEYEKYFTRTQRIVESCFYK